MIRTLQQMTRSRFVAWSTLWFVALAPGFASADEPPTLPAAEPTLAAVMPAGLARGTSVEATIEGANLAAVTGVRISGRGVQAELLPPTQGRKPNPRLVTVKLTATSDAELGLHELRLVTPSGTSNVVRLVVGTLPEVNEVEPNETAAVSQRLSQLPVVVNGAINRGEDRDCYRFSAKRDQTIVMDLCGQRLHPYVGNQRPGWFEGLLTIREATEIGIAADAVAAVEAVVTDKTAALKSANSSLAELRKATERVNANKSATKEEKATANDKLATAQKQAKQISDALAAANTQVAELKAKRDQVASATFRHLAYAQDFGGREDPALIFTVPHDGQYVLEVRDDLYRGRAEFNYRLTIGELPCVTSVYPAGGKRGTTIPLQIEGYNLDNLTQRNWSFAANASVGQPIFERVTSARGPSNDFALDVSDDTEVLEVEPNNHAAHATPITVPAVLNGVIERDGDVDLFKFTVDKNQRLTFETICSTIGSPVDARVEILDSQGRRVKEGDDLNGYSDTIVEHTFNTAGDYFVRMSDTLGVGSRRHVYHLRVHPARPDFALSVSPDTPRVTAGGTVVLRVRAQRRDGFNGDISVHVTNAPVGAVISPTVIRAGQTEAVMAVTLPASAEPSVTPLQLVGQAQLDDQTTLNNAASATEALRYNNDWRYVPVNDVVLSVLPAAPVTLSWEQPTAKVISGKTIELKVKAHRVAGFTAPVRIVLDGLPGRVNSPPVTIEEKSSEATLEIRTSNGTPPSLANVIAVGTVTAQNVTFVQASQALALEIAAAPAPAPAPAKK